jgi:hypothetical protein
MAAGRSGSGSAHVGDDTGKGTAVDTGTPSRKRAGSSVKSSAPQSSPSKGIGALERLCGRDDGWLRLAPDCNMNQVYLKFKFVGGRLSNHYVMVMCHWSEAAWGLELLEQKIEQVYAGSLRPVVDKWYQVD